MGDYWRGSEPFVIARGTRVDRRAQILEGAVVGFNQEESKLAPVYASGPANKLNLALH